MFERATREWRDVAARSRPSARRACPCACGWSAQSSSACVGCSCVPSPALTTAASTCLAMKCGAPDEAWRRTITSGAIACRFLAVSSSVSPLVVDEVEPEMLTASADSRLAAISNEVRVRVDASRNRLMTVLPRSVGTFLIGPRRRSRRRCSREIEDLRRSRPPPAARCRAGAGAANALMPRLSRSTARSGSPRSCSMTCTDSRRGGLRR